jgi:hypothetical protein
MVAYSSGGRPGARTSGFALEGLKRRARGLLLGASPWWHPGRGKGAGEAVASRWARDRVVRSNGGMRYDLSRLWWWKRERKREGRKGRQIRLFEGRGLLLVVVAQAKYRQ